MIAKHLEFRTKNLINQKNSLHMKKLSKNSSKPSIFNSQRDIKIDQLLDKFYVSSAKLNITD